MSIEVSGIEDSPEADQPILERVVEILRQDPAIKDGFAIANYQVPGNEVSDCDRLFSLRFKDQIRIGI